MQGGLVLQRCPQAALWGAPRGARGQRVDAQLPNAQSPIREHGGIYWRLSHLKEEHMDLIIPPKTTQSPINSPTLSNRRLGIWRLPIGRTPISHSRQATLWRGFRRPSWTRPHKRGRPQRCARGELGLKKSPQAALGHGLCGSLSSKFTQRGRPQRPRPGELVLKGSPEAAL